MTLTVLDLFSGIGGISLGLERTGGFRTVAFCEIEPFPREVLRKHWPTVPVFEDVTKLRGAEVGAVDMICGGFPCQDVSVAGKGAGLDGKRSGLWSELARLVGELGPRWVLAENVGALRTRGVDRVCADLEGEGYSVWPLLVGAWAVGAPHKRERVWIVGHRTGDYERGARERREDEGQSPRRSGELAHSGRGRGDGRALGARAIEAGEGVAEGGRALANRDGEGRGGERRGGLLDGERAASRDDADGRGERPVGDTTSAGQQAERGPSPFCGGDADSASALSQPEGERRAQQGHGRDAGSRFGCDGPRWPARPGEPQHEWEEPRLAHGREPNAAGRSADERGSRWAEDAGGDGTLRAGQSGCPQLPLDAATDGLSRRLVRLARWGNRAALAAVGNSVVPAVVEAVGYAILAAEGERRE